MNALERRLEQIERQVGAQMTTPRFARWWSCYVRLGHEDEDKAEAARLAGVALTDRDCVMVGVMNPSAPLHWPIPPMEVWSIW